MQKQMRHRDNPLAGLASNVDDLSNGIKARLLAGPNGEVKPKAAAAPKPETMACTSLLANDGANE